MPRGSTELLTVSRALLVLRAFTEERPTWGVTELAAELGLDKSQVHRLLATLAQHGFVAPVPPSRRYALGPAAVTLGHLAEMSPGVRHRFDTHLARLSAATGESVVVAVPDGFRYRTVAAQEGPGLLRYNTQVGRSYPGHLGATGHAIFAFHRGISAVDLLTADGSPATPDDVAALRDRHETIRRDGYAISEGEYDPRVMSVACPLMLDGRIFGSVSVLGPKESMSERRDELIRAVRDAASAIQEPPGA